MTYNYFEMNKSINIHMINVVAISFFIQCFARDNKSVCSLPKQISSKTVFHFGRRHKSDGEGKKFFRQNLFRRRATQSRQYKSVQSISNSLPCFKLLSTCIEVTRWRIGRSHFRRKRISPIIFSPKRIFDRKLITIENN